MYTFLSKCYTKPKINQFKMFQKCVVLPGVGCHPVYVTAIKRNQGSHVISETVRDYV